MTTVSAERLASVFVEFADTLTEQFDLLEFLHMLTGRTADLVGAAAVGLVLANKNGNLEFIAGSDEKAKLLELFQLQNREGPCQEAYRTGRPVVNVDLGEAASRWPRFAPQASALGFRSVHAFPLRLRSQTIGALNVFSDTSEGNFDRKDVPIVQALADVAAISLLQERAIHRGEVLTEQLQSALNTRVVIEQAKGAIAQIHQISVDDAFVRIRAYARNNNRRLTDVAHAVISDRSSVPGLA
ncbi:GAF and ANTAR domain-containing protein [Cryptosporangium arvum]|uniref:Response regulator with putative antiterminator output domain n=1 Tax=Cryptosporangium arvum DSM 44712 TaxID=927661 RepID=A0A010ZKQ6_9ACTN|nr:GAF and ANTAR domain-containing protein [Cryptosporangium arvum]EXG79229.1 response regulator with putative antiterminator output domain [Cryptosporangium arvum DSM 44712]